MKNPLSYQATEYDCGPTSMLNAVSYLFRREEIPPIIIKHIMAYCLDSYNAKGEFGKGGTSGIALKYTSDWLNQYNRIYKFPINCRYIIGSDVSITEHSIITKTLRNGGAAVIRVRYGCWHYILLTGIDNGFINLFDPYYRKKPFKNSGIIMIPDAPTKMNRKVSYGILNGEGKSIYEMGPKETREAVILYNLKTKTAESV